MSVEPVTSAPDPPTVRVTLSQSTRRLSAPNGSPRRNRRRAVRTARMACLADAPPETALAVERLRAEA